MKVDRTLKKAFEPSSDKITDFLERLIQQLWVGLFWGEWKARMKSGDLGRLDCGSGDESE